MDTTVPSASENNISSAQQFSSPSTHLLHIYRQGGPFSHDLTILDSDKTTPLYRISHSPRTFGSNAQTTVYRPQSPSQPVGTAIFSGVHGRNVELQVHGHPIPFERPRGVLVRYEYTWQSGIGPLKWCCASGMGRSLICVNERGEWVAKYETVLYAREKRGRLEIVNWDIRDGALDEIVVTGLAVAEVTRKRRRD